MNSWQDYIKGKKITVMGLGLLGRGIGDVIFLVEQGAELIVTDLKTQKELEPSLKQLEEVLGDLYSKITFVLGEHRLEDFRNRDFILKAAGVPFDSIYIEEARKNNIPIEMSTALFAAFSQAKIIGITGTRGKSTVTYMLHTVLQQAFRNTETKVFLGGTIRGLSTLQFLKEIKTGDIAVLELDSWQLQGYGDRKISPHVSIFTTFFDDHLNYYQGDREIYLRDKANIFINQKPEDFLVIGEQAKPALENYLKEIKSKVIIASAENLPQDWQLKIPGEHNRYNAALAMKAAEILEINPEIIKTALENFNGVSGRLEFLSEINGVKIYNDNNSTTPVATLAGLKALGSKKNIILIMGGADKQLNMSELLSSIPDYCKSLILLSGTGSEKLSLDQNKINIVKADSLEFAVQEAIKQAQSGDVILFSPAFASFGMFKNEYDRGDQFVELVKNLK